MGFYLTLKWHMSIEQSNLHFTKVKFTLNTLPFNSVYIILPTLLSFLPIFIARVFTYSDHQKNYHSMGEIYLLDTASYLQYLN